MLAGERTGHLVIRSIRQGRPQRGGRWGGYNLELQKKVCEYFTITEKAPYKGFGLKRLLARFHI